MVFYLNKYIKMAFKLKLNETVRQQKMALVSERHLTSHFSLKFLGKNARHALGGKYARERCHLRPKDEANHSMLILDKKRMSNNNSTIVFSPNTNTPPRCFTSLVKIFYVTLGLKYRTNTQGAILAAPSFGNFFLDLPCSRLISNQFSFVGD